MILFYQAQVLIQIILFITQGIKLNLDRKSYLSLTWLIWGIIDI